MTTLARWDPFREMMALRGTMDRLFEDSMQSMNLTPQGNVDAVFSLPVDVTEDEGEYIVKASIPGMPIESLEITIENNVLTISGKHETETEKEDRHYIVHERRVGQFRRSITLPSTIDESGITAESENGVLSVHVPKTEAAKPKRIKVNMPKEIESKAA